MNNGNLKKNVTTLQRLRDVYHSQLDAGTLAELDDVLQQLTRLVECEETEASLGELAMRSVRIIDNVLILVTNITNWLQ
ncbi:hypothetical protein GPA19_20665 [Azoarcus indigens]|uniref:Uncharacterized protein n=1 Tax=Azoarcus indigens TaxID=29545 RepID=A0A4R6EFW6_9RHOO|nr:hypothetical protein [Azoarcus indigens]NMG67359.1 hypothetical protein [Azoarcus indigens]TDN57180.1 hypothetical protein C7389_101566 [Azoarcus indigens]